MASEGRAAAPAQASTAASPPLFLAPTASATAPSSPSSLHLISLPPHERSSRHRLLAAVDRASSRISSAHVACRIGDEAHEAPSGLRFWPFSRSLPPLSYFAPRPGLAALTALTAASHLALLVSRLAQVAAWPQMPDQPQEQPLVQQPLEQPSPLPLQRRSFEPPRAAHPVRVRVAACLRATPPSTTCVIDIAWPRRPRGAQPPRSGGLW
jgi:hypothetical protein